MRIAFVQTYPVYHDLVSTDAWLARRDRDRWMPEATAALGHDVELWAVDHAPSVHERDGFVIRLFEPTAPEPESKFHWSDGAMSHARAFAPHLCVLKGVDGGLGERLIESFLEPSGIPFVFVIGGKFYTKHVPDAAVVFYEDDFQARRLAKPPLPWRRKVDESRLIRLPKVIDTGRFRPIPETGKTWDLLSIGRLVPRFKNFDALAAFPRDLRIAVLGGGPELPRLSRRYPWIAWLGPADHSEVPAYLNRARLLVHPGRRERFPRVLAEAAACGTPAVAFADSIGEDVLPASRGLRVTRRGMVREVMALLGDAGRMERISRECRADAERLFGLDALAQPIEDMLERVLADGISTATR